MMFHSVMFVLGFMPFCLAGFFAIGRLFGAAWSLRWLIAADLLFYAWWNPAQTPILIASVAGNYAIGRKLGRGGRPRLWLTAGILANLLLLGWFKYANFFLHIAVPDAATLDVTLPLGISFFTFQQIMFLADTARTGERPPAFRFYAAFVTFFPHLIAGPIVRPREIIPQLAATGLARPNTANLTDGLLIFLLGLAKKLVLADMFAGFADVGFDAANHGAALSFFEAWYATLSFALQIYFDFSGYSDMATGLARMLNIRFPLNFDSPYQAASIAQFWRCWHITLGAFLRDYLYIPLGGNRSRETLNLMATMLLAGLWHGAAWTFVAWGALHGVFLLVHRQYRRLFPPLPRLAGRALTLFAVVVAWVPFRAGSLSDTVGVLGGMAGFNGISVPRLIVAAFPSLAFIVRPVAVLPFLGDGRTLSFPEVSACLLLGWLIVLALPNIHRMTRQTRHWALTAGFALSIQALFFAPHVAPFLYFQF
ncbi:MAG TPA: MBOAT family protein [Acetobacteraceae bacterium]|jgi:alginate O-acetyltransferase complex protein AlgI|nr:MBOAT family protein [Acetobacteraceae bacterium]